MRCCGMTRRRARVIAWLLTPLMLGGCGSVSGGGDFCRLYEPVYFDDADTQATIAALMRNNAVWLELCGK